MIPILFSFGLFKIYSYSICIFISILVFLYKSTSDSNLLKLVDKWFFVDTIVETAIISIVGARVIHFISEFNNYDSLIDIFKIYNGGLSVLGATIFGLSYYLSKLYFYNLDYLKILDITAKYAPLLNAISRIGCFLSGCCYGFSTNFFISVIYKNNFCVAPLFKSLFPIQLLSSLVFIFIYILLSIIYKSFNNYKGITIVSYIMFSSLERFLLDFLRGDRIFVYDSILSFHQYIAIIMILLSSFCYIYIFFKNFSYKRL